MSVGCGADAMAPTRETLRLVPDPGAPVRVLWLHDTDRWYFGDFLRHAAWLGWLRENLPAATIDLASHPAYLPLYADPRFGDGLDVSTLGPHRVRGYDLVVEPTSFPLEAPPDPRVRRLLRTWDAGWALYAYGHQIDAGVKDVLNYFRAAHPDALLGIDEEGDCAGTALVFSPAEQQAARAVLDGVVPGGRPVLIYNPTASNPFTRETDAIKEVDNTLDPNQHAAVLRRIAAGMPDHDMLVAAPFKPGDQANIDALMQVSAAVPGVRCLLDQRDRNVPPAFDPTGLRGFAAVLAAPRVCGSVGAGTGSNAHLAALTGTWSLSFERAADPEMLRNWSRSSAFRMGSFRWRNPSQLTAIHLMRWDRLQEAEFDLAAEAVLCHHRALHLLDLENTSERAVALTLDMTPAVWRHYTDFRDEMAYLQHLAGINDGDRLIQQLYLDSNLNKLARWIHR